MNVAIPVVAIAFGSVTPPQGDVIELRIHLGCTKEVSSFECFLQNFDKKYTVTNPINVGDNCHFDVGRGSNCPLILTGRVEEVEPESTPVENYIRVRGRCWGEKIFRRVVTETYENKKGEEIVRDLVDNYVGLSHTRTKSDLTSDAASGQKDVVVADTSIFSVGDLVRVEDNNAWEYNEVSAVNTVTNTLTMVNNLGNTYTVLANGRVWIDLVEKTDTTYTLLEYKDATVFDILKYIAESADKSGVIGFDFRVVWDGKFAFFRKNSISSPISLSEKIEHSRYSKDIHRIRNKIMVYGAAEKPYPLDTDGQPWSDSLTEDLTKPDNYLQHADGRWDPLIPTPENLSIETAVVHTGTKSVKISSMSYDYYMGIKFTFNSDKYVNGNRYPKLCFTLREDNNHNKRITVGLTDKNGNDCWQSIDIAAYDEWQSYMLGVGKHNQETWTLGNSEFDWENIKEVRFDFHQKTSQYGVAYVDRMHFGGCRWSATEEDSSSQSSYGLRELVEVDEELHSDNECSLRGKALLNHLSQPAEFLTLRTTCLDYGTDRLLPGDKIHVTLPNENIDSDFRIISVEYRVSARDQMLEITLELGKEKPLLADYLYGLRSTTITVEKLMRTKAGITGAIGGGGGGGGGGDGGTDEKVKVSSDDTTTDFLLAKLLAGTGITLTEKNPAGNEQVEITAHRKWSWADEQGWILTYRLPLSKQNGWTRYSGNPVLTATPGAWDAGHVCNPSLVYKDSKYWLFYAGEDAGQATGFDIGVAYSTDGINFAKSTSNPIISRGGAGSHDADNCYKPCVIYDEIAGNWKMWYTGEEGGQSYARFATANDPEGPWTKQGDCSGLTGYGYELAVVRLGNLFYCIYRDTNHDLRLAVSSDGQDFTYIATVITRGSAGEWDDTRLGFSSLWWNLGVYYVAYSGHDGNGWKGVGLALSSNGKDYSKFYQNPVLEPGTSGEWDDQMVLYGSLFMMDDKFRTYYQGKRSTTNWSIGFATIP